MISTEFMQILIITMQILIYMNLIKIKYIKAGQKEARWKGKNSLIIISVTPPAPNQTCLYTLTF